MTTAEALDVALALLHDTRGRGSYKTREGVIYRASDLHAATAILTDHRADLPLVQDEFTNLPTDAESDRIAQLEGDKS